MKVVKNEVLKLLYVGIIYLISDSKWVSPAQVVPKKSRIAIVKNEKVNQSQYEFHLVGACALIIEN